MEVLYSSMMSLLLGIKTPLVKMAETAEVSTSSPFELLAAGRRHLAVKDFNVAASTLSKACEALAKEHGEMADQCAEAYLWYGKALLGLSREESGVLGDGVPGTGEPDEEDDNEEQLENVEEQNREVKAESTTEPDTEMSHDVEKTEASSTTKDEDQVNSAENDDIDEPTTTNRGDVNEDDSTVNMENEDEVDNLQLAWETLDLARNILYRRVQDVGGDAARALLAEVHLSLGEVALESETYDKAVIDMQTCLDLQKELYGSDDRRIAETHYQIGLANSLASNFEDAITHFKNAANILESRIKTLENPMAASEDAIVKKYSTADPFYSVEGEIKELKELLPEIQEKIQDMMDYKAETIKRVRESLCQTNGTTAESSSSNGAGASSSSSERKPAASDISHLIKRKRKASDSEAESSSSSKRMTT